MRVNWHKIVSRICLIVTFLLLPIFIHQSQTTGRNSINKEYFQTKNISQYDQLFKTVSKNTGIDWQLLSAIAYTESRFKNDLKSKLGAVGLMQIKPITAKHFNIPAETISDPFINILVSAKLLKEIESTFHLSTLPDSTKYPIILAGYNCGIGKLQNARQLAKEENSNHNNWNDLKNYLTCKETQAFVRNVMVKWDEYKLAIK